MSTRRHAVTQAADEGFAMVVAVIITTVSLVIATTVLAVGLHLDTQTVRERRWQLALQVAELGIERDAALLAQALASGGSYTGNASPTDVPGGEVATRVAAIPGSDGYQLDAVSYVPSFTAANRIMRRVRVLYQPEPVFEYALFSNTDLFVKSVGGIEGDVYGNLDVELWNGTDIYGDVVSASGTVLLNQNARIVEDADGDGGNVYSGGAKTTGAPRWAVKLDNNAEIENDVFTRVASLPCTLPSNYNVVNNGSIGGFVYTPGAVFGTAPAGGVTSRCTLRPGTATLPPFNPGALTYDETISVSTFNSRTTLSGSIYVTASTSDVVDLACKTITGNFTLVTEAKVEKSNTCGTTIPTYNGPADAIVLIVALNPSTNPSNPSLEFENTFEITAPAPAVLIYSKGYCDLKNNVISTGAVYCNGMNIQNNMEITYDKRIERVLGFGDSLFTKAFFRELPPSTALTAA